MAKHWLTWCWQNKRYERICIWTEEIAQSPFTYPSKSDVNRLLACVRVSWIFFVRTGRVVSTIQMFLWVFLSSFFVWVSSVYWLCCICSYLLFYSTKTWFIRAFIHNIMKIMMSQNFHKIWISLILCLFLDNYSVKLIFHFFFVYVNAFHSNVVHVCIKIMTFFKYVFTII